ncbi:MAG: PIG-L family deacetylase [Bacteriovoracaceae bacterium]|nr:PIG-L family deacetylase [Bacteriovoracaceae bacterium]
MSSQQLLNAINLSEFEKVIILSPHLDDAVYSCGGLLWQLKDSCNVHVITTNSGDPSMPLRQGHIAPAIRRKEDILVMQKIGCQFLHVGFLDAIFRRIDGSLDYIYDNIIGLDKPAAEDQLYQEALATFLKKITHQMGKSLIFSPMAIGGHVDHLITALVSLGLEDGQTTVLFYEDWPYVANNLQQIPKTPLSKYGLELSASYHCTIDPEAKQSLVRMYESQLSTLFESDAVLLKNIYFRKVEDKPVEQFWKLTKKR